MRTADGRSVDGKFPTALAGPAASRCALAVGGMGVGSHAPRRRSLDHRLSVMLRGPGADGKAGPDGERLVRLDAVRGGLPAGATVRHNLG